MPPRVAVKTSCFNICKVLRGVYSIGMGAHTYVRVCIMLHKHEGLSDNLMAFVPLYIFLVGPMPHLWGM